MANDGSIVSARFNETAQSTTSREVYQYDHGLILYIYGLNDLQVDQVHFTNSDNGKAINNLAIKESDGSIMVDIPDVLLAQDKDISAYLYVEDDTSGYTARIVRIPMNPRSKPDNLTFDSPSMGAVNQIAEEQRALINDVESLKSETIKATDAANLSSQNANTGASNANAATSSANKAAESATKSAESATTAAENAQAAANRLNNVSFEINLDDGCLYVQMT